MKYTKILTILCVFTLVLSVNTTTEFKAGSKQFCDLVTASEGTTANCNQKELHLINGSFEDYVLTDYTSEDFLITNADNVGSWHTTATDNRMELWTKDAYERLVPTGDSSVITGNQIAELNATQNAALYQDFETVPGQTIKVSLKHGGRFDNEQLAVMIGAPNNYSAGDKYPTAGHANDVVMTNSVNSGEWDTLSVLYEVPAGQTTTRIAFNSENAGTNGNLLEDITIGVDSIYDLNIDILKIQDQNSYASDYLIVNKVSHVYGDYLGKFIIDINLENFANVKNIKVYDAKYNEIDLAELDYTMSDNHIYIEGTKLEEGYFTFLADSALQDAGELSIESAIYYYSQLDMAIYDAGLPVDDYYMTRDINRIDTSNYAPMITSQPAEVVEETEITSELLSQALNLGIEDFEDDKNGAMTSVNVIEKSIDAIDSSKPGTYKVVIIGNDSNGARTISSEDVTITDLLPEITVTDEMIQVEVNQELTAADVISATNATASEIENGDLNEQLTIDLSAVNTNVAGTYNVDLVVYDEEGNQASKTITIKVIPSISVDSKLSIYEEHPLTDQQLISMFNLQVEGANAPVSVDQAAVDYSTPGLYELSFSTTIDGTTYTEYSTLEILDLVPSISVAKKKVVTSLNKPFTDQELINVFEITASEASRNDLLANVEVDQSAVNYAVSGAYDIKFSTSDEEGNAVSAYAHINVMRDASLELIVPDTGLNTAPSISGAATKTIDEGSNLSLHQLLELFEVVIIDNDDNLSNVIVDDSNVDYHTPGSYEVIVVAEDEMGLASQMSFTIEIIDLLPQLFVSEEVIINLGDVYSAEELLVLFNVSAKEIYDNDLTDSVIINIDSVDFTTAGEYPVYFEVSDFEGNTASFESTLIIKASDREVSVDATPGVEALEEAEREVSVDVTPDLDSTIEDSIEEELELNESIETELNESNETVTSDIESELNESNETVTLDVELELNEGNEAEERVTLLETGQGLNLFYLLLLVLISLGVTKKKLSNI